MDVGALQMMRTLVASASALGVGLVNLATGRDQGPRVQLQPGDVAPDFELRGSDGCLYRLRDFRDDQTVVLAWFPKAFTGGCTRECRSLGESGPRLKAFRARYFGANVDTPETNRRFAESLGIDYAILSDPDGNVARAYGVLGASGFPSRWTFFIGTDGRIVDIDRHVQVSTHGADIAAKLAGFGTPRL
jgi:peroxiredoxin Q/BCP